jgi:Na+/H+-dicarboxylate symporter
MNTPIDHTLTQRILLALGLGLVVGLALHHLSDKGDWLETWLVNGVFWLLGKWLIALLMLLVVPLVLVSLMRGVGSLLHTTPLGRLSAWTLGLYLLTTAIAIGTGLLFAGVFAPGQGLGLTIPEQKDLSPSSLYRSWRLYRKTIHSRLEPTIRPGWLHFLKPSRRFPSAPLYQQRLAYREPRF